MNVVLLRKCCRGKGEAKSTLFEFLFKVILNYFNIPSNFMTKQ